MATRQNAQRWETEQRFGGVPVFTAARARGIATSAGVLHAGDRRFRTIDEVWRYATRILTQAARPLGNRGERVSRRRPGPAVVARRGVQLARPEDLRASLRRHRPGDRRVAAQRAAAGAGRGMAGPMIEVDRAIGAAEPDSYRAKDADVVDALSPP